MQLPSLFRVRYDNQFFCIYKNNNNNNNNNNNDDDDDDDMVAVIYFILLLSSEHDVGKRGSVHHWRTVFDDRRSADYHLLETHTR